MHPDERSLHSLQALADLDTAEAGAAVRAAAAKLSATAERAEANSLYCRQLEGEIRRAQGRPGMNPAAIQHLSAKFSLARREERQMLEELRVLQDQDAASRSVLAETRHRQGVLVRAAEVHRQGRRAQARTRESSLLEDLWLARRLGGEEVS